MLIKIQEAVTTIREKISLQPALAIVLGSGLGEFAQQLENPVVLPYSDIPGFPVSSVVGHASQLAAGTLHGKPVYIMQGRFHYYEGYTQQQVVMPVRVLRALGVKKLLLTNAAGGINEMLRPGDLVSITDHINMSGDNPLIGKNLKDFGPRFPDMSCAYHKEMRALLLQCAQKLGIGLREGVYAMMTGPSFETPAEIRMLRALGADVVGMSTVPEVIAANHCGLDVAVLSCVTNMAAGILDQPLTHEEVLETTQMVMDKFNALLNAFIQNVEIV